LDGTPQVCGNSFASLVLLDVGFSGLSKDLVGFQGLVGFQRIGSVWFFADTGGWSFLRIRPVFGILGFYGF
jgi:hypothetical protein